jgi:hypothetical protein
MIGAVQGMQASEMPPTAAEVQACGQQQAAYQTVMGKWAALKAKAAGPAAAPAAGRAGGK